MKENYRKAIWSYDRYSKTYQDGKSYVFTSRDIDHQKRLIKTYNIDPESLDIVKVDFIVQTERLIRFIIKELDTLLRVGGTFEIYIMNSKAHSMYYRSRDQVKYEFSIATNGRYVLSDTKNGGVNGVLKLIYTKLYPTLPPDDQMDNWSFGIITNGSKLDSVNTLIRSIRKQNIPNCEIIICGPYLDEESIRENKLIILDDVVLHGDLRVPTPAKKNRIIERATYNNLVILHDRFCLPDEWYMRMVDYGNYFDYLCLPTVDKKKNRFGVDWMSFEFPLTKRFSNKNHSLSYNEWSEDIIIQGGVIVGKCKQMIKYKLDERLYWEELEDMHFSKVASLDGAFFYLDDRNYFISESVNHKQLKKVKKINKTKLNILWVYLIVKNFLKYHFLLWRYYKR